MIRLTKILGSANRLMPQYSRGLSGSAEPPGIDGIKEDVNTCQIEQS